MIYCHFCYKYKEDFMLIPVTTYAYCSDGSNKTVKNDWPMCQSCYDSRMKKHMELKYV